jgi:hypothetical protein
MFGAEAVQQIREVVTGTARRPRPQQGATPGDPRGFVWVAKVQTPSTGIAANSHASCTAGAWNGSAYITTAITYDCWNPSTTTAVSSSTWVTINWVSGRWEVVLDPC